MKIIIIVLITFVLSEKCYTQSVLVVETKQITNSEDGEFFFPHFFNNDSEIVFTRSNYIGLFRVDIDSKNIKQITNENGAGYKPFISDVSKNIFYKSFVLKDGKKFNSLKEYDTKLNKTKTIEEEKRLLNLPSQTNSSKIAYLVNSSYTTFAIAKEELSKNNSKLKSMYVDDNQLYLTENNLTKIFSPLGKGIYVWESFSKDGEKVVFTFGNRGTFICDLEGKILNNIPEAHYPKFSPDGNFILYMVDKDNGHSYTSSDIFVYSLNDKKSFQITNTDDNIEMYAEWSNMGDSIVYHTVAGEIYLTKLDIQN